MTLASLFATFVALNSVAQDPATSAAELSEFTFQSPAARDWMIRARRHHGLMGEQAVSLTGTMRRGDVVHHVAIALDALHHYERSGALIERDGAAQRLTGQVTHILDGTSYRQVPTVPQSLADVAHPRLESEYRRASVTTLLRPPSGRPMKVRAGARRSYLAAVVQPLEVRSDDDQIVCVLMVRVKDAEIVGWTLMAETSVGAMPQSVAIERTQNVDGVVLPVLQREQTGDHYGSVTSFTDVRVGDLARQAFTR
jgi:hypothetical protein